MGANTVADDFSSFAPDDPDVIQQNVTQGQNALWSRSDSGGRYQQMIANGRDNAVGNPLVNKARTIQNQFKSILEDVNSNAPEDEDPLDANVRLNQGILRGMADTSPQMAMQAAGNLVKLQQAKTQQDLLTSETDSRNALTEKEETETRGAKQEARYIPVEISKDAYGLPSYKKVGDEVPMYDADGNYRSQDFAKEYTQAIAGAKKNGAQNVTMMTVDKYDKSLEASGLLGARARIFGAQQKAAGNGPTLDADSVDQLARAYDLDKSVLAGLGSGAVGAANRAAVVNRWSQNQAAAGLSGADTVAKRDVARTNASAMLAAGKQYTAVTAYAGTLDKNLGVLEQLADRVDDTGVPVLNRWIRSGRKAIAGDPDVTAFDAQMRFVKTEAARVVNNPNLTGVLTNEAQEEMDKVFTGQGITSDQIHTLAALMRGDAQRRASSLEETMRARRENIRSGTLPGDKPPTRPDQGASGGDAARLQSARDAIKRGADADAVKKRLGPELAAKL
jgi:hypothetical protein